MTVKKIAELAGVSIGTVDRVLHRRGRVSAETRAKIEAIVERSGFKPNTIARRLKRGKPYRFLALVPERREDSGYWGQALDGIASAAEEIRHEGIETEFREFDRYDAASFRSAAEAAIAQRPDAVLLAPVMPQEARLFVSRLEGTVPYAFFDADLPGTSPVCGIGQDPFRGGYLAGRLAGLYSPSGRVFAVVAAHGEDYHIKTRRDGFTAYAAERGLSAVVAPNVDLEDSGAAERLVFSLVREQPELAGIFVTSASCHRVADAVRLYRARGRFAVVGFDLVPENERLLRDGAIDAIISQRPRTQGRRGLLDLYRSVVLGREVERRVEVPIDIFIAENLPEAEGRGYDRS